MQLTQYSEHNTLSIIYVARKEKPKNDLQSSFAIELICRHETPVLANPIKLIHVDEDLVVLDKPCSLPVSTRVFPV